MKKILFLFIIFLTPFFVSQVEAAILVTQPTVSSGDSWTVNYNNGQIFEFDMNYSGQWPVLLCKNFASGSVGIWFQTNEVYVKTSGGFIQRLGWISSGANTHYKVVCNNNDVFVYADGNLVGNATDSSINVPSNIFVNNPRVDFVANGYTQMTNFSIADSEVNIAPTITSITVPTTTQLQNTPVNISGEFTDTCTSDTHMATIDWGDGTSSPGNVTESNGSGSVTGSHSYFSGGDFTIKLTVTDQDGASSRKEAQVHINLSPTIYRIERTSNGSNTYNATGYFSDSDSDSWTGSVNYGDGSVAQLLQTDNQSHTFSLNHSYSCNEEFTITVTIIDDRQQPSSPFSFKSNLLVVQPKVSSGDSWTVNYNNGLTFEFDMDYTGQWPVLLCKNSSSGSVGVWFQTNEVNIKTSAGFFQRLGGIYAVATNHYKVVCDNDTVAVYYNDSLLGKATDNSINVPSGNFINQPRADFIANGYTRMNNFVIYNNNLPPSINEISNVTVDEGDIYNTDGSFADSDSSSWTATVDYGDGTGAQPLTLNSDKTFSLGHTYIDNKTDKTAYTLTISITDNEGAEGNATAKITVNNVNPKIENITIPTDPIAVNTQITASAPFTDAGVLDTHTAVWNWGDETTSAGTVAESNGSGSVSDGHIYTTSGVYEITLTVTDKDGGVVTQTFQYLSVYSPTPQGLFSAGQKYTSPAGAYLQDPTATGNVMFGLSYKYQGDVPVGNRQFTMDFKTANFEFNASTISSFVISNGVGTLRGTGTITNRSGEYGFLIVGKEGSDTIRIKITDPSNNNAVIYDTQPGTSDTATPTIVVTAGNVLAH